MVSESMFTNQFVITFVIFIVNIIGYYKNVTFQYLVTGIKDQKGI